MHSIVIADTSCLIVLQKIDRFFILKALFSEITITEEIATEFGEALPDWFNIEAPKHLTNLQILKLILDSGEASAIALGLEKKDCLILIDEKKGRYKSKELGLNIMGTLGVLIKAKEKGLITSLKEEIENLQRVDFRISDELIFNILDKHD